MSSNPIGYVALQGAALLAMGALFGRGPLRRIGNIIAEVTVKEDHLDQVRTTDHPVEQGAMITDHAIKLPPEVTIIAGWSPGLSTIFNTTYLKDVYDKLLTLQNSRVPFSIVTGRRNYFDMLMTSLATTTDEKTNNILMVTARCRHIILVNTQVVTVPPNSVQASPQSTGSVQQVGQQQLQPSSNLNTEALPSFNGGTA